MRNIWMSRLGRASTVLAIAGIAIAAMGLGASAEARDYGYWNRWGYHHYYSHPWWGPRYYYGYNNYNYAPRYYGYPTYYGAPSYAYTDPGYGYYGPSFNVTIPLR
jgi:hypothetical protein